MKFTTLYSFCSQGGDLCTDGENSLGALIQGTDGIFYGTTSYGGAYFYDGTAFSITAGGTFTTLHNFCFDCSASGGDRPFAGLVQGTNGKFYGTTYGGGALGYLCDPTCGTLFGMTAGGTLKTLHSFDGTDGAWSYAGLVQATNGMFYGTTDGGGTSKVCSSGCGTVFSMTAQGTLTTLHSFDGTDGIGPMGGLVRGTNGKFYGTTAGGGVGRACLPRQNCGTVFNITPGGIFTTLYSFCSKSDCTDGAWPNAGMIEGTDGSFYGTTYVGGAYGGGTIFRITAGGARTTLYDFCSQTKCADGDGPLAGLVQGTDGNFYGTTEYGGTVNDCLGYGSCGTVFSITPGGTLTTLHTFYGKDGAYPYEALVQGTDGSFYGTTTDGGANYAGGTIFSLSVGLGPFVETQPASRRVGKPVKILGANLTGATSVTFNGTVATFSVVSSSEITTTVPTGATTGTVQVETPGGTLSSNVPFRVTHP